MKHRPSLALLALATLFAAGGSQCPRREPYPAPVIFSALPSAEQVIAAVNANSAPIRQLQSSGATLSAPGMPTRLRANIAYERPGRFRLLADTSITGPEIDLGSNDDLFWLWVRRNQPPAVYFARHDQFRYSAARAALPVQPDWLIEALGVVRFDPAVRHEGPIPLRAGRFQMRSIIPSPDGDLTRVTVIDDTRGWILEQHIYDAAGRRLASSIASEHYYDPAFGVSLPRHVEIQIPPARMSFTIDVAGYVINQLAGDPGRLWSMPRPAGYPLVDLTDPTAPLPIRPPDVGMGGPRPNGGRVTALLPR